MTEKWLKQLTPGHRCMIGVVLFLIGLIWQSVSEKTLDMYAFYIMSAAVLCITNILVEKMAKGTSNLISYIFLNMAVVFAGFSLSASTVTQGVIMYGVWGICVFADWVVNAALLRCEGIVKRIAMGVVASFLNIVFIGIVFMIPVLIAAAGY